MSMANLPLSVILDLWSGLERSRHKEIPFEVYAFVLCGSHRPRGISDEDEDRIAGALTDVLRTFAMKNDCFINVTISGCRFGDGYVRIDYPGGGSVPPFDHRVQVEVLER